MTLTLAELARTALLELRTRARPRSPEERKRRGPVSLLDELEEGDVGVYVRLTTGSAGWASRRMPSLVAVRNARIEDGGRALVLELAAFDA